LGYLPKGMRVESTPESSRVRQIGYILRAPLRLYIPSTYFGYMLAISWVFRREAECFHAGKGGWLMWPDPARPAPVCP